MAAKRFLSSLGSTAVLVAALMACGSSDGGSPSGNNAQNPGSNESESGANSETAQALIGHWRTTTIVFESPEDEHMILHADGTWENWVVTVSGRSATTTGAWRVQDTQLVMRPTDSDEEVVRPFTMFDGQLVLPNIPDHRLFWERISL